MRNTKEPKEETNREDLEIMVKRHLQLKSRRDFLSNALSVGAAILTIGYAASYLAEGSIEQGKVIDKPSEKARIVYDHPLEPGGWKVSIPINIDPVYHLKVKGTCTNLMGKVWEGILTVPVTEKQYNHYDIGDIYIREECDRIR